MLTRTSLRLIGLILLSLVCFSFTARAQRALRRGTRPFVASFAIGPAIELKDIPTQFKILQEFGYHFQGDSSGPALGLTLEESFGDDAFVFFVGPKFWWDIQPIRNSGFYIAPMICLGYALLSYDRLYRDNLDFDFFSLQMGADLKLIIGNRGLVFFRPMTFNFFIGDDFTGVRYDMMFGGGVTF